MDSSFSNRFLFPKPQKENFSVSRSFKGTSHRGLTPDRCFSTWNYLDCMPTNLNKIEMKCPKHLKLNSISSRLQGAFVLWPITCDKVGPWLSSHKLLQNWFLLPFVTHVYLPAAYGALLRAMKATHWLL